MSGGQKQRIAIARAIIKNPKILLLDEATSALDAESEKVVQDALNSVMKGRTTVIVAHRLSTVRDADVIAVVHEGNIVELGNHATLIEKKGHYFDLVHNQNKENEKRERSDTTFGAEEKKKLLNSSINLEKLEKKEGSQADEKEEELKEVPYSRILAVNLPEIQYVILGCFASIVLGVVNPIFSILFSEMVNLFYQPAATIEHEVWKWVVGFVSIGVGMFVAMMISSTPFSIAGQHLVQRIREMTFRSILRQNIGFFHKKRKWNRCSHCSVGVRSNFLGYNGWNKNWTWCSKFHCFDCWFSD